MPSTKLTPETLGQAKQRGCIHCGGRPIQKYFDKKDPDTDEVRKIPTFLGCEHHGDTCFKGWTLSESTMTEWWNDTEEFAEAPPSTDELKELRSNLSRLKSRTGSWYQATKLMQHHGGKTYDQGRFRKIAEGTMVPKTDTVLDYLRVSRLALGTRSTKLIKPVVPAPIDVTVPKPMFVSTTTTSTFPVKITKPDGLTIEAQLTLDQFRSLVA